MLQYFEAEGFRGFRDRVRFDLKARNYDFNLEVVSQDIIKNSLIYGKNGSGKSSLGIALFDVIAHLTDKRHFDPEYLEAYKNLDRPENEPISFAYAFRFGDTNVHYRYTKNAPHDLLHETLSVDGVPVIDYDYADPSCRMVDRTFFGDIRIDLPDNRLSVLKYLYRNLPTNKVPFLTKLFKFCEGMLWFRSLSDGNVYAGYTTDSWRLSDVLYDSQKLEDFAAFLRENGITYDLEFREVDGKQQLFVRFAGGRVANFFSVASTGTRALMLFYTWSVSAFNDITLLFIDEFDAFLHYESAAAIVRRLNGIPNFQSILTTHNTYLMQNKFTRPDACFLITDTRICTLAEATQKELREAHNLEKLYVNGAFCE